MLSAFKVRIRILAGDAGKFPFSSPPVMSLEIPANRIMFRYVGRNNPLRLRFRNMDKSETNRPTLPLCIPSKCVFQARLHIIGLAIVPVHPYIQATVRHNRLAKQHKEIRVLKGKVTLILRAICRCVKIYVPVTGETYEGVNQRKHSVLNVRLDEVVHYKITSVPFATKRGMTTWNGLLNSFTTHKTI